MKGGKSLFVCLQFNHYLQLISNKLENFELLLPFRILDYKDGEAHNNDDGTSD